MDNKNIWKPIATAAGIVAAILLLWYFRSIVAYIAIAAVISLIGRPIMHLLSKIRIKNFKFPRPLAAVITIFLIFGTLASLFLLFNPLVIEISGRIQSFASEMDSAFVATPIAKINDYLIESFPNKFNEGFRIEKAAFDFVVNLFSISSVSSMVSSLFSFIADVAVALFSILFISFFFLSNEGMATKFITDIVPDKYAKKINNASGSIHTLLTRYFIGIILESLGITILNSIGLIFILKMDVTLAIVIALITGILNVVPYVGPLIGHCIALIMSIVTFSTTGINVSFLSYLLMTFGITMTTQIIDNYLFQPLIYSSSVKAHPLEIFIVILMAGHIGGIVGMLVAIPCYTVLRVIASEFLQNIKIFRTISRNIEKPSE